MMNVDFFSGVVLTKALLPEWIQRPFTSHANRLTLAPVRSATWFQAEWARGPDFLGSGGPKRLRTNVSGALLS